MQAQYPLCTAVGIEYNFSKKEELETIKQEKQQPSTIVIQQTFFEYEENIKHAEDLIVNQGEVQDLPQEPVNNRKENSGRKAKPNTEKKNHAKAFDFSNMPYVTLLTTSGKEVTELCENEYNLNAFTRQKNIELENIKSVYGSIICHMPCVIFTRNSIAHVAVFEITYAYIKNLAKEIAFPKKKVIEAVQSIYNSIFLHTPDGELSTLALTAQIKYIKDKNNLRSHIIKVLNSQKKEKAQPKPKARKACIIKAPAMPYKIPAFGRVRVSGF